MLTGPGFAEVVHNGLDVLEGSRCVGPQVGAVARTLAGLEHLHRRLVGVQYALAQYLGFERIHQRLQPHAAGSCWDQNEYNGESLPESARPAGRYLTGAFVFFSTRSTYNANPGTYDARHNKISEEEFRAYIAYHAKRDG